MSRRSVTGFDKAVRVLVISVLALSVPAMAQDVAVEEPLVDVAWVAGPSNAALGRVARIDVPESFVFLNADDTQKLMELMQNPVAGNELGLVAPADDDWFVLFQFDAMGYVRDDEKDRLDADALLESISKANEAGNKIRRRRGWPTLETVGWAVSPHYNEQTHNLEWAIQARSSDGSDVVNYNTRLLGRRGVMSAQLVVEPNELDDTLPTFNALLDGYEFQGGERYAEFRQGDKIAKIGLAALITGGAAAVAVKAGLLQKFWKFIAIGIVGAVALDSSPRSNTPTERAPQWEMR